MTVTDILFFISLKNHTRVFDNGNSLRLEWSRNGLRVCINTVGATIICPNSSQIPLPEGNVIEWSTFDRKKFYSIFHNNTKGPKFRVYDDDSKQWLDFTDGESNAEIMKQTALALEDVYAKSHHIDVLKECFETAKTILPTNVDDNLRDKVINRWHTRLKKVAAATFTNPNSTDEQLYMAYVVLSER